MSFPPPEQPPPPGYQPVPPAPPPTYPPPVSPPAFTTPPLAPPPVAPPPAPAEKPKRKRPIGWIITVTLLSLALIAAGVLFVLAYLRLQEAESVIQDQNDLIDEKQSFTAAMQELVYTAVLFDGQRVGMLVDTDRFEIFASRAYAQRHDAFAVADIAADVRTQTRGLEDELAAAQEQLATNASGTAYESVIDSLGGGYVTTVIDDADGLCESDVLGCVISDDPRVVHIDAADVSLPYMTEFIQQGVAYHEFAHVLQLTHQEVSEQAAEAFSGDMEQMADCFALTYLDGWTLHHTVPINAFEYYEVDIGYGYTCDDSQRQLVEDWYDSLGYVTPEVAQERGVTLPRERAWLVREAGLRRAALRR